MGKPLVTREEWLDHGLQQFGRSGPSGLRVERMARALGCSKSSFYWYFGTKRAFEIAVIRHWRTRETEAIIDAAEQRSTPTDKLSDLVTRVVGLQKAGDFLFHLRELARRDAKARAILIETEATRVDYVARVLVATGQPSARARERAEILYSYYLGWFERQKLNRLTPAEVARQLRTVSRLLRVPLRETRREGT